MTNFRFGLAIVVVGLAAFTSRAAEKDYEGTINRLEDFSTKNYQVTLLAADGSEVNALAKIDGLQTLAEIAYRAGTSVLISVDAGTNELLSIRVPFALKPSAGAAAGTYREVEVRGFYGTTKAWKVELTINGAPVSATVNVDSLQRLLQTALERKVKLYEVSIDDKSQVTKVSLPRLIERKNSNQK